MEAAVLERINQELGQEILDRKDQEPDAVYLATDGRQSKFPSIKEMKKMCMALEKKQDLLKREKQYLYEQYKLDQMERRIYLNKVGVLREEESRLSEQLQKIQDEREQREEESSSHQEEAEYTGKMESLTREVVDEWIEAIYVYGKSQFDIIYKENIKKYKRNIKNC